MLSDNQVADIRQMISDGVIEQEIARRFQVTQQYVSAVKHNRKRPGLGPDVSGVRRRRVVKERDAIVDDIRAGLSSKQISDKHGIWRSGVYYLANRHGLKVKVGKTPLHSSRYKLTYRKAQAIRRSGARGVSRRDLATRYGVHISTIDKILAGDTWTKAYRSAYRQGKRYRPRAQASDSTDGVAG